jgi:hypothetical protein
MHVGDETDAAGVMFAPRAIEALRGGEAGIAGGLSPGGLNQGGLAGNSRVNRSSHYLFLS